MLFYSISAVGFMSNNKKINNILHILASISIVNEMKSALQMSSSVSENFEWLKTMSRKKNSGFTLKCKVIGLQ